MLRAIQSELYRVFHYKYLYITLLLSFSMTSAVFVYTIITSWGMLAIKRLSYVDEWLLSPGHASFFYIYQQIIVFFGLPVTVNMLYYNELKGKSQMHIVCRCGYKNYLIAKVVSYGIAAMVLVFLPLFVEALLCRMCFPGPMETYYNGSLQPAWRSYVWRSAYVNSVMYYEHPMLLVSVYCLTSTIVAWWMGLLAFALTAVYPGKRMVSIFGPFLAHMAISLLADWLSVIIPAINVINVVYITLPHHTASAWQNLIVAIPVYTMCCLVICYFSARPKDILR